MAIAARDRTEVLCSHGEQLWPPSSARRSASVKTKWRANNHAPRTGISCIRKHPQLGNCNCTWPSLWCLLDSSQDCPVTDRSNLHEKLVLQAIFLPADKLPGFFQNKVRASRCLASQPTAFQFYFSFKQPPRNTPECTWWRRAAIHPEPASMTFPVTHI